MTITTAVLSPASTAVTDTTADAYLKWLCCASQEVAAAFGGYGLLSGRSNTSLVVATGSKAFVLVENSAFAKGMYVTAYNARDRNVFMSGIVTSYSALTLTVTVEQAGGIGDTVDVWIVQATARPSLGQSTQNEVRLEVGNGSGSDYNKIRRFTSAVVNTGTAMTYADSATLGGSITINEIGWYSINASDKHASANYNYGVTKNTAEPTVAFGSIADKDEILCIGFIYGTTHQPTSCIVLLTAGDVIRLHGNGSTSTTNDVFLWVRKIA